MEPTSAKVRSLSFDSQVFGQPQPWAVHHRGVEQEGEVIVAERVNPAWGRRPEGGLGFRLVFFTVPRRISSVRIEDPRIAMAVPRRSPLQVRPSLDSEIKAIHEARARYVTARDPDALALRRSMEEREVSVRGEIARQFAVSFAQGRIYTHPGVSVRPRDIFEGDTPEAWADRLASAVLSLAYPSPLFDHSSFPYSLTADGVSAVYRGLFHGDADAVDMVEAFGPGLGLTRPDAPSRFDAGECRAVDVVLRLLEARGGEMPAEEMLRELTDGHGIVRPLALLYLLDFVRQARGQVTLEPDHGAVSRRGRPFLADRITWDLVSEVSFSGSLADHLGTVRLRPAVTWDTVLPYASLVVDGLEPAEDSERVSLQERRLLDALGTLRSQASHAREALGMLEPYLGRAPRGALEASDMLEALCEPSGYREFYSEAQQRFQGPSGFAETLEVHRRLVQLADHAPAMAEAKRYLDSMTFGQDHRDLSFERDSIGARFDPESLMTSPSVWSSIQDRFQRLRARYINEYVAYHTRYNQEAIDLSRRLEALRPQVEAVATFNEMPELGEPVGADVRQRFQEVVAAFRVCTAEVDETSLEALPYHQACRLSLEEDMPREIVSLLFSGTERAMREYNRRLSSRAVRRILAHPTREQLDRFVDMVNVSDPSALANVLDDEVVEFLRKFMGNG